MALDRLTKIDGGGISTTSDYRVGIITATKFVGPIEGVITSADATFTGNVSIGGTLTYEDVTNVDSVGVITARSAIDCNGDLDVDGHTNLDNVSVAGVSTFTKVGATAVFNSGAANDGRLEFQYNNSRVGLLAYHSNRLEIQTDSSKDFTIRTNGANERLRILSNGKVGVGLTDPAHNLDVYLTGRFNQLGQGGHGLLVGPGTNTGGFTYMGTGDVEISCAMANKDIIFSDAVGGNQRMRLTGDTGRLGIGTNPAYAKLEIGTGTETNSNTEYYGQDFAIAVRANRGNGADEEGNGIVFLQKWWSNSTDLVRTGAILGYKQSGDGNFGGGLIFKTQENGANPMSEKLRITRDGDLSLRSTTQNAFVGLKVNSTAINFTLGSTAGASPRMYFYGTGNGQSSAGDIFTGSGTGGILHYRSGGLIKFEVNSDNSTTEALRITSDGKVGIGTVNPESGLLQVIDSGYHQINISGNKTANANKTAGISFLNYQGGRTSVFQTFANSSSNTLYYGSADSSARGVTAHKFYVNADQNATTGHDLALTITSGGNIGINRSNPDQRLNVSGNIEVNAYDNANGSGGYYTSKGLIIGNAYDAGKTGLTDDRNAIIWQERGLDLDFATNDTFRMKITYDGNVGIGTVPASGTTLDIDASGGGVLALRRSATNASNKITLSHDGTDGTLESTNKILFRAGGDERLQIRSDGAMSAKRSAGAALELLRNTATTGTTDKLGEIIFGSADWDSSTASIISYQDGAKDKGALTFHTQASVGTGIRERIRITSDGKVGINQTTWTNKDHVFEVKQETNDKEIARFTNAGGVSGSVQGKGFIGLSAFNSTTYPHAYIGVEEDGTGNYEGNLTFATRNTTNDSVPIERLRITSSGLLQGTSGQHDGGLDLLSGNNNQSTRLRIQSKNSGGTAYNWYLDSARSVDRFTIHDGITSWFTILGTGEVGINDTSPDATLSVSGDTAFIDVGTAGGNRGKIGYSSNDLYFGTSSSSGEFIFKNNINSDGNPASSGTERVRITSDGELLIPGTQTVSDQTGMLDIYHTSPAEIDSPHIRLWGPSNQDARIEFGSETNSGEGGYISYNDADEGLYIGSRMAGYSEVKLCTGMNDGSPHSNERLTVNSVGRIGHYNTTNFDREAYTKGGTVYGGGDATGENSVNPGAHAFINSTPIRGTNTRYSFWTQTGDAYPNASAHIDFTVQNAYMYRVLIKGSHSSATADIAQFFIYGLANNAGTLPPLIEQVTTTTPSFNGDGSGNFGNTSGSFTCKVMGYGTSGGTRGSTGTYDTTLRIEYSGNNNQGLIAFIERWDQGI